MPDRTTITALNRLLETCRDAEMGFWSAADHVGDDGLKWMFRDVAKKRGRFADELKEEIRRLGGAAEEGGSVAGSAHRGWMDVRDALARRSDAGVIAEAERGEQSAVHAYEAVLDRPLPPSAETIVRAQYADVKEAHARIKALEEEWKRRTP